MKGGEKLTKYLQGIITRARSPDLLRVGFLQGSTYPDGTSVPMVAAIQNFGAPAAHIPSRPFFSNMVKEKSPKWGDSLAKVLKAADYDKDVALARMGTHIKGQLQTAITEFDSVPLSPSTIVAKGNSKQLVDTGHMLNSVDYEVKP